MGSQNTPYKLGLIILGVRVLDKISINFFLYFEELIFKASNHS